MAKTPTYYNVRPRYTPGSGAMVDERTALKVAAEEKRFYEIAQSGAFGEEDLEKTKTLGVKGIVESIREHKGGWIVNDLITGETFWRAQIKPKRLVPGDRLLEHHLTVQTLSKYRDRGETRWGIHTTDTHPLKRYMTFGDGELVKVERSTVP